MATVEFYPAHLVKELLREIHETAEGGYECDAHGALESIQNMVEAFREKQA